MDSIANLLTTIRNGYAQQKEQVVVPASNLSKKICQVLKKYGFILEVKKQKESNLEITLRYSSGIPAVNFIKRISKPSCRRYSRAKNIPRPSHGRGIIIISTPQGIMPHFQARKKNLGGEIICEVA